MNRSSKLTNILNRRSDLWNGSETDTSSSSNDNHMKRSTRQISIENADTSSDENSESSIIRTCCLICSILPNLTNVNTCQKHLMSLTTATPVVYMMHPAMNNCSQSHHHCRSKCKRCCRSSSSSSSSSSESRHYRKKRSKVVLSSNTSSEEDLFFSPDAQSQPTTTNNQQYQFNYTQARLSPSLPPSAIINTTTSDSLQKYHQLVLTSFFPRTKQQNSAERNEIQDESLLSENSSDEIEIDSDISYYSPSRSSNRIVHVKDDDEIVNDTDRKNVSINMAQVTEQMINHQYPQPVIFLKRVCLDDYQLNCDYT